VGNRFRSAAEFLLWCPAAASRCCTQKGGTLDSRHLDIDWKHDDAAAGAEECEQARSFELTEPWRWNRQHRNWPSELESLSHPPRRLWLCGQIPGCWPTVAIVGSRKASVAGLRFAFEIASELTLSGFRIVSGLARGIDAAALEGAVCSAAQGGPAPLVLLGNGLPAIYPPENQQLARRIIDLGGSLMSEYRPGTAPLRHHFPHRNRLISGWSLAVVVVEATRKSGSMGTASHALDQGREVCAVPGPVLRGTHDGCHDLIQSGAHLVTCARDVIEICGGIAEGKEVFERGSRGDRVEMKCLLDQHQLTLDQVLLVTRWTPLRLLRAFCAVESQRSQ